MSNMIINDMDKNWGKLIIVYGLSDEQINEVKSNAPTKDSEVFCAECFTDIIAFPQMASVIIWSILTDDDKELLVDYYSDVAPLAETVILIGDVDIPGELKKHMLIYTTFEEFASKMKYVFLGAYKRIKKNSNFSSTLANAIMILSEIRKKPYVTTRELAEKLELSDRSIQRYIDTLRIAGEWIEYDLTHKGWTLTDGVSMLWGDVWEQD